MSDYRIPDFGFEWYNYLKKPWRLRWRWMPLPWYYGREFREDYSLVSRSLHWSREQITMYQWNKIKQLLEHAYRTVPYYQEWFRQMKITPDDMRDFSDYSRLPTISRVEIRNNLAAFTSSELKMHRGFPSKTSGTTGYPLQFYRSPAVESMRQAVVWRHYNQVGYRFKQRRVSLNLTFEGDNADLLYTYEPLDNLLALNGSLLLRKTVRDIHALIKRFQPTMFFGHPSALSTLASHMKRLNLEPLDVPVVLVYSELMTDGTRKTIQNHIGSNLYDYFANRENTISASQFPCGNYHINSEFVYVELTESREEFAEERLSRVLGTSLTNYAMPLLRYDGDDLASSIGACPDCGIQHPVIKFVGGRAKDFLVSRHGLLQCKFDDILLDTGLELLDDFQIVQTDIETIALRLVPSTRYDRVRDEEVVVELLNRDTRGWFRINVEYVESIPRTKGFKRAKVVSSLASRELEAG